MHCKDCQWWTELTNREVYTPVWTFANPDVNQGALSGVGTCRGAPPMFTEIGAMFPQVDGSEHCGAFKARADT